MHLRSHTFLTILQDLPRQKEQQQQQNCSSSGEEGGAASDWAVTQVGGKGGCTKRHPGTNHELNRPQRTLTRHLQTKFHCGNMQKSTWRGVRVENGRAEGSECSPPPTPCMKSTGGYLRASAWGVEGMRETLGRAWGRETLAGDGQAISQAIRAPREPAKASSFPKLSTLLQTLAWYPSPSIPLGG
jgi:hypothetical protein